MFLRKAVQRTFLNKEGSDNVIGRSTTPPSKRILTEAPSKRSSSSSEVEYIEDDDNYDDENAVIRPTKHPILPVVPQEAAVNIKVKEMEDTLLSLSVVIPAGPVDLDDDSSRCSGENGILTKLPRHLIEKKDDGFKHESRPSMNTSSTTSEGHGTQATVALSLSETGSYAGASSFQDTANTNEKKILANRKSVFESKFFKKGEDDPRFVSFLLELGSLHMQCNQYVEARACFHQALNISERIYDSSDLKIARALELLGTAESAAAHPRDGADSLVIALSSLKRALCIRYEQLGATHIDTVESLNKIARVQMKMEKYLNARDSYFEVLKVREAIFGSRHPCIAATAQNLASVHAKLLAIKEANHFYLQALEVYRQNGLHRHSLAETIRRDMKDLKAIKVRYEI